MVCCCFFFFFFVEALLSLLLLLLHTTAKPTVFLPAVAQQIFCISLLSVVKGTTPPCGFVQHFDPRASKRCGEPSDKNHLEICTLDATSDR